MERLYCCSFLLFCLCSIPLYKTQQDAAHTHIYTDTLSHIIKYRSALTQQWQSIVHWEPQLLRLKLKIPIKGESQHYVYQMKCLNLLPPIDKPLYCVLLCLSLLNWCVTILSCVSLRPAGVSRLPARLAARKPEEQRAR